MEQETSSADHHSLFYRYMVIEVITHANLGYVVAETPGAGYQLAMRDQNEGIHCKISKHGIRVPDVSNDSPAVGGPARVIWF